MLYFPCDVYNSVLFSAGRKFLVSFVNGGSMNIINRHMKIYNSEDFGGTQLLITVQKGSRIAYLHKRLFFPDYKEVQIFHVEIVQDRSVNPNDDSMLGAGMVTGAILGGFIGALIASAPYPIKWDIDFKIWLKDGRCIKTTVKDETTVKLLEPFMHTRSWELDDYNDALERQRQAVKQEQNHQWQAAQQSVNRQKQQSANNTNAENLQVKKELVALKESIKELEKQKEEQAGLFCGKCGHEVKIEDAYCSRCGSKLENENNSLANTQNNLETPPPLITSYENPIPIPYSNTILGAAVKLPPYSQGTMVIHKALGKGIVLEKRGDTLILMLFNKEVKELCISLCEEKGLLSQPGTTNSIEDKALEENYEKYLELHPDYYNRREVYQANEISKKHKTLTSDEQYRIYGHDENIGYFGEAVDTAVDYGYLEDDYDCDL